MTLALNRVLAGLLSAGVPMDLAKREAVRLCKQSANAHELCPDKHTPQTPNKDLARQWGIGSCNKRGAIITISPGALGALQWMKWGGPVLVCDICKACVNNAKRMSRYYKSLDILAYNKSVQDMTRMWVAAAPKQKLSCVDVDLAFSIQKSIPILRPVLNTLVEARVNTTVLLTYVNYRDGMGRNGDERRIAYLESSLPSKVKYVGSHNYASGWSDEHHSYSQGSAMSIAKLEVKAA